MSSFRAKAVRAVTGAWFKTVNAEKANVQHVRGVWHFLARTLWTASGVDVRRTTVAGMTSEWLTPQAPARGKVLLYLPLKAHSSKLPLGWSKQPLAESNCAKSMRHWLKG